MTTSKYIRNTFYNSLGFGWTTLMYLLMTPYILHHVGVARFGIWVLGGVIAKSLSMLDLCIGSSCIKFISEYRTKDDFDKLTRVVNTGFGFYLVFAGIVTFPLIFAIDYLVVLFRVPVALHAEAAFVFLLALLFFGTSNALRIYTTICDGLQRMDLTNTIGIATTLIWIAGTIVSLECGYGLYGLSISQFVSYIVYIVIIIGIIPRLLPQLRVNPFTFDTTMFRRIFKFGLQVQIDRIAELVNTQMDKLLISYFLGVSPVSFYEIASKITLFIRSLPTVIASALLPATSEISSQRNEASLYNVYLQTSRCLALFAVPMVIFVATAAPWVIRAWMGTGYEQAVPVLRWLGVACLASVLAVVIRSMTQGVNRPDLLVRQALLQAPLNIGASVVLIFIFGYVGAAMGNAVAAIVGTAFLFIQFHRYLRRPLLVFARAVLLGPFLASGIAALVIAGGNQIIDPGQFCISRFDYVFGLCMEGLVFVAIYVAAIFCFPSIRRDAIRTSETLLRRLIA